MVYTKKSHKILKKLSKLTNHIIIKDHFEHGFFSRQLLRFVDFYANFVKNIHNYGWKIKKYLQYFIPTYPLLFTW